MENLKKETIEKLANVLASDEMESKIDSCNSMEEILAELKAEGADVTEEELNAFLETINRSDNNDDSLSEKDLEEVAGGWWLLNRIKAELKKAKQQIEYVFGGGYVVDVATGKRKFKW